jgi:hypothetical protein
VGYSDGSTERHEMMRVTASGWVPRGSDEPLRLATRVVLDNGTVVKDRHGPAPGEAWPATMIG